MSDRDNEIIEAARHVADLEWGLIRDGVLRGTHPLNGAIASLRDALATHTAREGLADTAPSMDRPGIPRGWEVEELGDEGYITVTHEDGSGALFTCNEDQARHATMYSYFRDLLEQRDTHTDTAPDGEGEG